VEPAKADSPKTSSARAVTDEEEEDRAMLEKTLLDVVTPHPKDNLPATPAAIDLSATKLVPVFDGTEAEEEMLIEPAALAERIAKLPMAWRASLMRHLEEAEADVSAEAFAVAIAAATHRPAAILPWVWDCLALQRRVLRGGVVLMQLLLICWQGR
jgi:hypothetical protein